MKNSAIDEKQSGIQVSLLNLKNGLTEYQDVTHIKITSKTYNIIIMKDYLPLIGEVEGNVEISKEGEIIKLDNITGYYIHKHNKFDLFIKDK